jgi:MFS transporter, FHS family, glucose/mannose:H+ symporter
MATATTPIRSLRFVTRGTTLIYIDFLLTGVVMTFLGPMLPVLSARWSLSDAQSGSLIFTEFFASMFGMLLSGVSVRRLGYRLTLIIGLILMPAGMAMLSLGSWRVGILSTCVLGLGYGITTPAGNLRTAETNPQRRASALNLINAVWGIGAMASPFLVALAVRTHRVGWFLTGTAVFLWMLLLAVALSRFDPDRRTSAARSVAPLPWWSSPMLPLVCVLFFVYVGTETSLGNWVAMYARRVSPQDHTLSTITPSFFWGALLAGRAFAPLALKRWRETYVAQAGLLVALVGAIGLAGAHGMGLVIAGAMFGGLGLAAIFPISVSLLPGWFQESAESASGAIFSSGNLGGAVLPWVVGAVSTHFGSLRAAFVVPLMGIAAMLTFYFGYGNAPVAVRWSQAPQPWVRR